MQEENYWTRALKRRLSRRQLITSGALAGVGVVAIANAVRNISSRDSGHTSTGNQKRGGVLRQSLSAAPLHLDAHTADEYMASGPIQYVYSSLLKLDEKRTDDLYTEFTIYNDLAQSFEQPEPSTFIFNLRKGVKFHDKPPVNARELTSEDIKYSMDRIRSTEPQFVRRAMFEDVERIETPDRYTVKFALKGPSVPFLYNIASPWTLIAAREVIDRDGDLKKTFIGTGPFVLDKYTRNEPLKFKRNPQYFLKDIPYLDGIDMTVISDASMAMAALRAKELDLMVASYSESENLKKIDPGVEVVRYPGMSKFICMMRLDRPPMDNPLVRKALMYATEYQEFIDTLAQGQGKRDGPVQWWLKPYALPEGELPETALDTARQLLAEAGYSDGFRIHATVCASLNGVRPAEIARSQWMNIGVDIDIKVLELGAWVDTVWNKKDFAITFLQDRNYEDPDAWLHPTFHSRGSQNYTGYSNPEMDALLDKQRGTLNVSERVEIIREIQTLLLEEAAYIPLFTPISYLVRRSYVKEWNPQASWAGQHSFGALRAWLDK